MTSIILETIEGNPSEEHPMKGKIIEAFAHANRQIAEKLGIKRIYVEQPVEETLPYYAIEGYRTGYFMAGQTFEAELYL